MDFALVVAIAAGAIAAVALALTIRGRAADKRADPGAHGLISSPESRQLVDQQAPDPQAKARGELVPAPESFLVPVGDPSAPDLFVSVGAVATLDVRDKRQLDLLPPSVRTELMERAGTSVGAANVAVQAVQGYQQAVNLVRLAPETVAQINRGAQVVQGASGYNIGVLRSATDSKWVAQVKWAPAGSALSVAAAMGNALTMAAIQWQLSQISDQLRAIDTKVSALVASDRYQQLAAVQSLAAAVDSQARQAMAAGAVSDRIMAEVNGAGQQLDAEIKRLSWQLRDRLVRIEAVRSIDDRLKWLQDEGFDAVEDVMQLAIAVRGWAQQRALYAANLWASSGQPGTNDAVVDRAVGVVMEDTRTRVGELEELLVTLGYELNRHLRLAASAPGRIKVREHVKDKFVQIETTSEQIRQRASALTRTLESAAIPVPDPPRLSSVPTFGVNADSANDEWEQLAPLLLRRDERPLVLLHGRGVGGRNNLVSQPSVMMVTDQRLIGFRRKTFVNGARLHVNEPLSSIKSVHSGEPLGFGHVIRFSIDRPTVKLNRNGIQVDMEMDEAQAQKAVSEIRPKLAAAERETASQPETILELNVGGDTPPLEA